MFLSWSPSAISASKRSSLGAILPLFACRFGLFAQPLRTLRIELLVQPIKVNLRPPAMHKWEPD